VGFIGPSGTGKSYRALSVAISRGYNGDLTSRDAGKIGGNIVKKVFEAYTGTNYNINKQ
jgi:hypothetical protein